MIKRLLDFVLALLALLALWPLLLAVWLAVRLSSPGPALYWSQRVGQDNRLFPMPKFRSMRIGTPAVATHLLQQADQFITPVGRFIRATSLDELPQLWSVLIGHMSLVGPRPALFNQHDLIEARTRVGVHHLRPGITGWAQINGRDEVPLDAKVALDAEYARRQSMIFDLWIMFLTVLRVVRRDGIRH